MPSEDEEAPPVPSRSKNTLTQWPNRISNIWWDVNGVLVAEWIARFDEQYTGHYVGDAAYKAISGLGWPYPPSGYRYHFEYVDARTWFLDDPVVTVSQGVYLALKTPGISDSDDVPTPATVSQVSQMIIDDAPTAPVTLKSNPNAILTRSRYVQPSEEKLEALEAHLGSDAWVAVRTLTENLAYVVQQHKKIEYELRHQRIAINRKIEESAWIIQQTQKTVNFLLKQGISRIEILEIMTLPTDSECIEFINGDPLTPEADDFFEIYDPRPGRTSTNQQGQSKVVRRPVPGKEMPLRSVQKDQSEGATDTPEGVTG